MGIAVAAAFAALAIPVGVAVWLRPQRGLLLLLALVPFDGLLLLTSAPISGWKEVLLAGTLVAAALRRDPVSERKAPPVPLWVWPLAVLAAVALVTVIWAPGLQAVVGLKVMFFGMLTAAVLWRCPLNARERDHAVTILMVTGAVVAVVGIGQQVVGHERLHELGYAYNSVIRFSGGFMRSWSTFNQPFGFAFFLMTVTLVAGSVALATPRPRNRVILALVPLYVAGMAVAFVRSAWIGLAAGLLYLAVTRYRVLLTAAPLVGGLLAVGVVLGLAGTFAFPSVEARFSRWEQVPAIVGAAPFGEGIGTAGAAAAKSELLAGGSPTFDPAKIATTRLVFQPDNNYLKVLYELGVPGLGLFVLALVAAFACTRASEPDPDLGAFAAGASALIVAAAVASLAASFFEIFPLDYVFWLVIGIATTGAGAREYVELVSPAVAATARSAS